MSIGILVIYTWLIDSVKSLEYMTHNKSIHRNYLLVPFYSFRICYCIYVIGFSYKTLNQIFKIELTQGPIDCHGFDT